MCSVSDGDGACDKPDPQWIGILELAVASVNNKNEKVPE
jgi:hypothetical protein